MTKKTQSSKLSQQEREDRRAAALRENLLRRKTQKQDRTAKAGVSASQKGE